MARSEDLIFEQQARQALEEWLGDNNRAMPEVLLDLGFIDAKSQLAFGDMNDMQLDKPNLLQNNSRLGQDELNQETRDSSCLRPISERFIKQKPIGSGGTSNVFDAVDADLDTRVALKVLKDSGSPARFLFNKEARLLASLSHPVIPTVFAIGHDEGLPCFAMELIEGKTLRKIERDALGNFDDDIETLEKVCQALSHAHENNVIHRDVKPDNIFVGDNGVIKLGDWGHATQLSCESKGDNSDEPMDEIHGTLAFVCPERLENRMIATPLVDIYSLGVTLYFCITGRMPFDSSNAGCRKAIELSQYTPPRNINPKIPKPLEAICLKAMAAKPEDRYVSTEELRIDLANLRKDKPIVAYESKLLAAKRFIRKNSSWIAATSVMLLCAFVLAVYLFQQAEKARTEAVAERDRSETIAGQSLAAFGDLIKSVSKGPNSLAAIPNGQGLRQTILTIAKDHLSDLAVQNSELVSPIPLSIALSQLGRVNLELGKTVVAKSQLEKAELIIIDELEQTPNNSELIEDLAACRHALAKVAVAESDFDNAIMRVESAIDLRQSLDPKPGTELHEGLCANTALVGAILNRMGKYPSAETKMNQVVRLIDEVPDAERSLYLRELEATTLQILGAAAAEQKKFDEAEKLFSLCAQAQKEIVNDLPWLQSAKHNLAMTQFNLGRLDFDRSKFETAIEKLEESERNSLELFNENPNAVEYVNTYANVKNIKAFCLAKLGQQKLAIANLNEMLQIIEPRMSSAQTLSQVSLTYCRARIFLAQQLQSQKDFDGASKSLRKALETIENFEGDLSPALAQLREMAEAELGKFGEGEQ